MNQTTASPEQIPGHRVSAIRGRRVPSPGTPNVTATLSDTTIDALLREYVAERRRHLGPCPDGFELLAYHLDEPPYHRDGDPVEAMRDHLALCLDCSGLLQDFAALEDGSVFVVELLDLPTRLAQRGTAGRGHLRGIGGGAHASNPITSR